MNRSLQDLARQAGFIDTDDSGRFDGATVFGTTHDTALATFAELIVNECCRSFQGYSFEDIAVKTLAATFRD